MLTDDPLHDFMQHDYEQQKALEELPMCEICGEYIQDEQAVFIDNEWYHLKCVTVDVDDYLERE